MARIIHSLVALVAVVFGVLSDAFRMEELKGEAQEAGEEEAKTRVVEDVVEKTDIEYIEGINCTSQTVLMKPRDVDADDIVVGFDEQSGDHHHGLECFRGQGLRSSLRKSYWNLDDKLQCEKGVAYVKNSNLIVPCVYTAMGKNAWSRKKDLVYGCMTGNFNRRCFFSSLLPLARQMQQKAITQCVQKLCYVAKKGLWKRDTKTAVAKSSPWPEVWSKGRFNGRFSASKGWMRVVEQRCTQGEVYGLFERLPLKKLKEQVAVDAASGNYNFNKVLCGCDSHDVCKDEKTE